MALNFPDAPTNGQKYTDSTTGETWTYELATNSWTSDGLTTAVGIQYKGGINITTAPPAGVKGGWQYTVATGGAANAGFTGLTGNIAAGTTIIFDGTNWQTAGAGVLWVRTGTALAPANAGDKVSAKHSSFLQPGTTALQRTVESKLQDNRSTSDYGTIQQAVDATSAGGTLYVATNPCSFDGVTINKAIRVVGQGREQGVVTGTIKVTDAGYAACFEDISFETPSGQWLFAITGRGGLDFKRCRFLPGPGKYAFDWDAAQGGTTYTPVALELIGSYFQSGKMLRVSGSAAKLFPIHAKEGCQTRFTETSPFDVANTSATAEFVQYEGQLDIAPGVATLGDITRLSLVLRNTGIDDGSNVCLTANLAITDIADCTIKANNISRQSVAPSVFKGSSLTAAQSMIRAAAQSGTVTLQPGLHGQDLFFIAGNATLTGNVTYGFGAAPLYDGQKVDVVFAGTTTTGAYTFNIFGMITVANVATIEPFVVTAYGYGGTWYPRLSGVRSAMTLQAVGTQAAIPDTSGAALAALEAEVNRIKAALRSTAIIKA